MMTVLRAVKHVAEVDIQWCDEERFTKFDGPLDDDG
jgi:hypothetical protein